MVDTPLSKLPAHATLDETEIGLLSQRSATIRISGTTISAQASDNSYNDSGAGFVTAGFAVDDYVNVIGFTGNAFRRTLGLVQGHPLSVPVRGFPSDADDC